MSHKLQSDKSQVNNFFHPIVDDMCAGHSFDTQEVTGNDNRILWTLINAMSRSDAFSVTMSRDMILSQNRAIKNVRTISRITGRWEKWGILEIKRGGYDRENRAWLPNTYSINWDAFFTHFGDFVDRLKGKFKALITKVKCQFLSLSGATKCPIDSETLCPTLKTQEKEKKTTYRLAEAHLYVPKEEKDFNLLKEKEESVSITVSEPDEISILVPHEPTKKHSFDVTMRNCPETYRAIALKEGIHSDWVDEEYEEFMRYWIGVAKTARGKKSDWPATWRNWVRSQVHDWRRKYKLKSRPFDPDAIACDVGDVKVDVMSCDDPVSIVMSKLRNKIGADVFKSWFDAAIFIACEDGYEACYQPKDSFIQHTVQQRFKRECDELNIFVTCIKH